MTATEDWLEIQIFDEEEIAAVRSGDLDGIVYKDGECWADVQALEKWRERVGMGRDGGPRSARSRWGRTICGTGARNDAP